MEVSVYQVLKESAERFPQHIAIADDYGCLRFKQLFEETEALRLRLEAIGICPSSGLGLMARNSREFIMGLFAGLGCGATVMPISHQLKHREFTALLEDAPLDFLISDGSGISLNNVDSQSIRCGNKPFYVSTLKAFTKPFVEHVPNAACVRFTSGTTGKAKGVVLSHQSVLDRTFAAQQALNLTHSDTVVWTLPMAYHFVVSIIMYVRYAVTMVICRDDLPQTLIDSVRAHKGTLLYASPSHYRILAEDVSGLDMPSLRQAISTSSGIHDHTARRFKERFGIPVSQVYGIIEVGLPAGNLHGTSDAITSIGQALPGFEVAILDDSSQELPQGVIGQLAFRGPGMFDAYLSPALLRDEVLKNGWFLTGDLAFKDRNGVVTVAGRSKSLINVSGKKVFPEEVEAIINSHESIAISRVYCKEHPEMGEVVAAELVAKNGSKPREEDLYRFFNERLSAHKVPRHIDFVPTITMTGTGKILRSS
ncbi:MAG: acyl--CoA ligase [Bdellovibrionales bacterium]|nr:acyl--CoA ligase [Bdellovibrionales bacterium]